MDLETKGRLLLAATAIFFVCGVFAFAIAPFLASKNDESTIINIVASDTHYKYFSVLLVPTTAYFVIANWVGWQYFRNS